MIEKIESEVERAQVFTRARRFVGSDEHFLAEDWLARDDIFCVAQENEGNGSYSEEQSLVQAFACFPESSWRAVEVVNRDRLHEPVRITNPVQHFTGGVYVDNLGSLYSGRGFLVFSMEYEAALLHSPEYEYRLIAGSAQFVRAFIDAASIDPIIELREVLQGNANRYKDRDPGYAAAIERALDMALAQVKIPPAASDLEG